MKGLANKNHLKRMIMWLPLYLGVNEIYIDRKEWRKSQENYKLLLQAYMKIKRINKSI